EDRTMTQTKLSRTTTAAAVLTSLLSSYAASATRAQTTKPEASTSAAPKAAAQTSPEEAKRRRDWKKSMIQKPAPKKGCFTATYPETAWHEVPCKPSKPHKLFLPQPRRISHLDTVGGRGPDCSATVTGHITVASGSFDHATGITSTGAYTLQLNTDQFTTSACSGSPDPTNCRGWEQFVYENSGTGFIQYWLIT